MEKVKRRKSKGISLPEHYRNYSESGKLFFAAQKIRQTTTLRNTGRLYNEVPESTLTYLYHNASLTETYFENYIWQTFCDIVQDDKIEEPNITDWFVEASAYLQDVGLLKLPVKKAMKRKAI